MVSGGQSSVGYQCICGAKFDNVNDLLDHLMKRERPPECPKRLISLYLRQRPAVDAERDQFYVHRKDQSAVPSPQLSHASDDTMRAQATREPRMPSKASRPGGEAGPGPALPVSAKR